MGNVASGPACCAKLPCCMLCSEWMPTLQFSEHIWYYKIRIANVASGPACCAVLPCCMLCSERMLTLHFIEHIWYYNIRIAIPILASLLALCPCSADGFALCVPSTDSPTSVFARPLRAFPSFNRQQRTTRLSRARPTRRRPARTLPCPSQSAPRR